MAGVSKRPRRSAKQRRNLPPMKAMCATCPWNPAAPQGYQELAVGIGSYVLHASHICNSTHDEAERICRGARDLQLKVFTAFGFFSEPTDAEWDRKVRELGLG